MSRVEPCRSRAILIGITGPIRAGKSWTTGNLVKALHSDLFQKLVKDNWSVLNGDDPTKVGSYLRGYDDSAKSGTNIWHSITPEQRLILCMDPWAKAENLDLSSTGEQEFRKRWAQDVFQIVPQDSFLSPAKNRANMVKKIQAAKEQIDADVSLSPYLIIEGYWLLQHSFFPEEVLPLLDYVIVLHASEDLILRRISKGSAEKNKQAWNKECAAYFRELKEMFPWMCPLQRALVANQDGAWHSVSDVASCQTRDSAGNDCVVSVPNLKLWIAQFSAPGANNRIDPQARVDDIVKQVVAKLQTHGGSGSGKRKCDDENCRGSDDGRRKWDDETDGWSGDRRHRDRDDRSYRDRDRAGGDRERDRGRGRHSDRGRDSDRARERRRGDRSRSR